MLCPQCHEEADIEQQDAEVVKAALEGTHAVIEVRQKALCGNCYKPIDIKNYRMTQDVGEQLAGHQGAGHELFLYPLKVEQLNGCYSVAYTISCSCDGHVVHSTGIAKRDPPLDEEARVPWD